MPTGLGGEAMWLCPSLDDSPNDLSGNGNNGTYVNGTSTVVDSDPTYGGSRAYDFDGTDDYIQTTLSDSSWRPTGTSDFSVSGWYKTKGKYLYNAVFSDGTVELGQISNFNRATAVGLVPLSYVNFVGTGYTSSGWGWHHFAMVQEGGSIRAYEDGILLATMAVGYDVTVDAQLYDARVGFRNGGTYASAYMDDIRAFSRVITQAEVTLLASTRGFTAGGGTHVHRTLLGVG